MKQKVYIVVIESREQLLDRIDIAAEKIRQNHGEIQRTTQSVSFRAQACLQSGGEHFENLLINQINITFISLLFNYY